MLMDRPGELIVKYQPLVQVVVQVFMKSGYFRGDEKEEIVQWVNLRLLDRIDRIRSQYSGISLLRTYFSSIIRNLCLEFIRKGKNQERVRMLNEDDHNLSYSPDHLKGMIIRQECQRLGLILNMFHHEKAKLLVCFKCLIRVPVTMKDIEAYALKTVPESICHPILQLRPDSGIPDRQLYQRLSVLVNHVEGRSGSADALRKFIWLREMEIIRLLNGEPPHACHNQETFRILLDRYLLGQDDCEEQLRTPKTGEKTYSYKTNP